MSHDRDANDFHVNTSSSDSEGEDEAEKFKNTYLKNGSKYHLISKQNDNLLIKPETEIEEDEEDFDKRTPKVLSSGENSDDEECKENRPL